MISTRTDSVKFPQHTIKHVANKMIGAQLKEISKSPSYPKINWFRTEIGAACLGVLDIDACPENVCKKLVNKYEHKLKKLSNKKDAIDDIESQAYTILINIRTVDVTPEIMLKVYEMWKDGAKKRDMFKVMPNVSNKYAVLDGLIKNGKILNEYKEKYGNLDIKYNFGKHSDILGEKYYNSSMCDGYIKAYNDFINSGTISLHVYCQKRNCKAWQVKPSIIKGYHIVKWKEGQENV